MPLFVVVVVVVLFLLQVRVQWVVWWQDQQEHFLPRIREHAFLHERHQRESGRWGLQTLDLSTLSLKEKKNTRDILVGTEGSGSCCGHVMCARNNFQFN